MSEDIVVESIKDVAKNVLPENAKLLLYGSRARGDYSEGSDWDLLVILDKAKIEQSITLSSQSLSVSCTAFWAK